MKKIVVLLILSFNIYFGFSQNFAPIGSTWYYTEHTFSGNIGYLKIESVKDTVINSQSCRKLYKEKTIGCSYHSVTEFVYSIDSTVYFWDSKLNKFQTLYDFKAGPGQSWDIQMPSLNTEDSIETIRFFVDSVKYEIINGQKLKMLYASSYYLNDSVYMPGKHSHKIAEKIGDLGYMFNFDLSSFIACDDNYSDGLRCYESPDFGYYSTGIAPSCTYSRENLWIHAEYHPFAGKGAMWYSKTSYINGFNTEHTNTFILSDTVEYNNKKYLNVNGGNAALREDFNNRKIYCYKDGQEVLLYDFNLNIGDTIYYYKDLINLGFYKVVDSIGTITLNSGGDRKIWYLTTYTTDAQSEDIWIEGIGSVIKSGVLSPLFPYIRTDGSSEYFGCFKYNDILYTDKNNSLGNTCPCGWTVDMKEVDDNPDKVSIYPNPATGFITIKNNQGNSMDIQIIDITGRTMKRLITNNTETTINLENYPSGLYSVRMNGENHKLIIY